jgi:hypothetical protein
MPSYQIVESFYIFKLKVDYVIKSMAYKTVGEDAKENYSIDFK